MKVLIYVKEKANYRKELVIELLDIDVYDKKENTEGDSQGEIANEVVDGKRVLEDQDQSKKQKKSAWDCLNLLLLFVLLDCSFYLCLNDWYWFWIALFCYIWGFMGEEKWIKAMLMDNCGYFEFSFLELILFKIVKILSLFCIHREFIGWSIIMNNNKFPFLKSNINSDVFEDFPDKGMFESSLMVNLFYVHSFDAKWIKSKSTCSMERGLDRRAEKWSILYEYCK